MKPVGNNKGVYLDRGDVQGLLDKTDIATTILETVTDFISKTYTPADVFDASEIVDTAGELVKSGVVKNIDPDQIFESEDLIAWVAANCKPDDVFDHKVLEQWAYDNGMDTVQ